MKKITWPLLLALGMGVYSPANAKVEHILPFPKHITAQKGNAVLTYAKGQTVTVTGIAKNSALERFLSEFGVQASFDEAGAGGNIQVRVGAQIMWNGKEVFNHDLAEYQNEAYHLVVTASGIIIDAASPVGVIRAAQTLTQMAEGWESKTGVNLEEADITDWPAFKLRGYMHDIGRSYMKVEELKTQIMNFSRFKVNTFHWHLTENQGFRFQVLDRPDVKGLEHISKINDASTMSRHEGQFYTQQECREIVALAKEYGVTIIPEIDIPGHSHAFTQAFGFDMQDARALPILVEILRQVADVFPKEVSPYIDFGADEVATNANFVKSIAEEIHKLGRLAEVWNPINGVDLAQTNTDLHHMWGTRGRALVGKPNIDSRYNYTNHHDIFADLVGIYKSNIYFEPYGTKTVAGAICATWNDRRVADDNQIMKLNNIYATTIATACRAWQGGGEQYIDRGNNYGRPSDSHSNDLKAGGVVLPNSGKEYDDFKRWEDAFLFHKENSLLKVAHQIPYVKQSNVRWRITEAFPNGGDKNMKFPPEEEFERQTDHSKTLPVSYNYGGKTYSSGMATGAGIYLSHTWGNDIIRGYYDNPQFGHTAYAWTYVYSPSVQTVGANIEFYNYSRSESNGIPSDGNWDHLGSKIWINGEAIPAPKYNRQDNTGSGKEKLLEDVNFAARTPIQVELKQGWNQVFFKLPYVNLNSRLPKWMFTCVFTDMSGLKAIDNLIYSPSQSMNVEAELTAVKIAEMETYRDSQVKDVPGYYNNPEAVSTLNATLDKVKATLKDDLTEEQRKQQVAELETALNAFKAALTKSAIVLPKSSTAESPIYYTIKADLRGNRVITSKGKDAAVMGETSYLKTSCWRFSDRGDGTFDVINYDGNFLSPASGYNTAIKAVAARPNKGWKIETTGNIGRMIINCGKVELNQTGEAQHYQIYNWSNGESGQDKTDTGCQFSISLVNDINNMSMGGYISAVGDMQTGRIYTFQNQRSSKFLTVNSEGSQVAVAGNVQPADQGGQWAYYESKMGFKYLYNVKGKKFMDFQNNNITLVAAPVGHGIEFKATTVAGHPVMFTLNKGGGSVHVGNGGNLMYWSGGYAHPEDGGNAYRLSYYDNANADLIKAIETAVNQYEASAEIAAKNVADLQSGVIYSIEAEGSAWISTTTDPAWLYGSSKKGVDLTTAKNSDAGHWVYYVSPKKNKYLYNVGAKKFLGGSAANENAGLPLVDTPNTTALKFKDSQKTNDFKIMMSADTQGNGVAHTKNVLNSYGIGNWAAGWNDNNNANSSHKMIRKGTASEQLLQDILVAVEKCEGKLTPENPLQAPSDITTGWYSVQAVSSNQNDMNGYISSSTNWMRTADTEYEQNASSFYPLMFAQKSADHPALHFVKITKDDNNFYFTAQNGHHVTEDCKASRTVPGNKTAITGSNTNLQIAKWNTYKANNLPYVGKYSNNATQYHIIPAPVEQYDMYTVNITGVENAAKIGEDKRVSCTHVGLKSMNKVYNNGVFFLEKGAKVNATHFTADNVVGLDAVVTITGQTVNVAYENNIRGNLELKINEAKARLNGTTEGNNPGNFNTASRAELQKAIDAAQQVLNQTGATDAAYTQATETLAAAIAAYNGKVMPVVYSTENNVTWYYIVSASTEAYCGGKVIQKRNQGGMTYALRQLDPTMVWSFWQQNGKVAIKNYAGGYMSKNQEKNHANAGVQADPAYNYTLTPWTGASVGGAAFTIKSDVSDQPLHAQNDNTVIVTWEPGDNNASLWKFEALSQEELNSNCTVTGADVKLIQTTTGIGNTDAALLKVNMQVAGLNGEAKVQGVQGTLGANAPVAKVKFCRTNDYKEYRKGLAGAEVLGEAVPNVDGSFDITLTQPQLLGRGVSPQYWLAVDVKDNAQEGSAIDAALTGVKMESGEVPINNGNPNHQTIVYLTASTVEYMDTHNSKFYRIPALTTTQNGWLVAVTDRRFNSVGDLPNEIDVVARISKDNGKTWTEPVVIAGTQELGGTYGHGDPAILTEKTTGDIVVLVVSKKAFTASTAADPQLIKKIVGKVTADGINWQAPVDITPFLYGKDCADATRKQYNAAFIGSGSFTQDKDGTLLAAALVRNAQKQPEAHVVTCQNYGTAQETWTMQNSVAIAGADEPKVLVKDNGDWLVKSRWRGTSAYAISTDKGATWSQRQNWPDLVEPSCNGDMIRYTSLSEGYDKNRVLASVPNYVDNSSFYYRANVSIFLSQNDAQTFPIKKSICPNESAYSSLTVLPDGTIGMYFEERSKHPNEDHPAYQMRFVRFSLNWLTDGQDKVVSVKEAALNDANEVMEKKGAGYPVAEWNGRNALQSAIDAYKASPMAESDRNTLAAAVEKYKNDAAGAAIDMPVAGKAYTFTLLLKSGAKRYMHFNGTHTSWVNELAKATPYICQKVGSDYMFVNNAGKYLVWFGNRNGYSDEGSKQGNNGFLSAYDARICAISMGKLSKGGQVGPAKDAELFGCLTFAGLRNEANDGGKKVFIVVGNNGNPDGAQEAYFNDKFSSAILMEEVAYANAPKLNPIVGNMVNIGEEKTIGTFSAPFATVVPEGVSAFYIAADDMYPESATLTKFTGAIPANEGVILTSKQTVASNIVMLPATSEAKADLNGNKLGNSAGAAKQLEGNFYLLGKYGDNVGFFLGNPGLLGMNKAYLPVDAAQAQGLKLVWNDVTGIEGIVTGEHADAPIYDLSGRCVLKTVKGGVYIQNKKKFIVK